jgi:hypothetical protein|tara:strand:+ start:160 stop:432 length:273 start_codon:yes stop_codon:yes gene_type:complete
MDQTLQLRIASLESKLDAVLAKLNVDESSQWIDTRATCSLLGITDRHLRNLITEGTIHGEALRNVGTVKKHRYRFHRELVMNQYLKRKGI